MDNRKIIFSHTRALGDGIMFTAGIRDFKLLFPDISVNVETNQAALWENNPYLDRTIKKGDPGVEYYKVGYPAIGNVNNSNIHFTSMFLLDMIAVADHHQRLPLSLGEFCAAFANGSVGDPSLGDLEKNKEAKEPFISLRTKYKEFCQKFTRQRGDLHLSDAEKKYSMIKEVYGLDKYWVIAPGGKRDCTAKIWDWRKFQQVVDYFEGRIKFVMIGKSDLLIEKLNNVIDLTDKFNTDIRGLISLVYHADGCVSGPSALLHMAAAVPPRFDTERKPCVAIFGGREPSAWTWYCNHQVLHTNGSFNCCDNGGCWQARTIPLPKDPKHNERLCEHPRSIEGRTVQSCMDVITSQDVIRAIEKYYDGNIYTYLSNVQPVKKQENIIKLYNTKEASLENTINLLGNLNSSGGGEQSLCTISEILGKHWDVKLYPWSTVHDNYKNNGFHIQPYSYKEGLIDKIDPGLPLLFYANDCIWDFVKTGQELVDKCSSLIININFANGTLPRADWLAKSGKLKAIVFHNQEKKDEFERDAIGFEQVKKIVLFGAIDLDKFIEVCPSPRKDNETLVILKHCVPDYRKYVTKESVGNGDKVHLWQRNLDKELDIKFYARLLKDTKDTRFEFMEAHKELVEEFKNEPRMVFHKWDSMPVEKFLARGHVYLYRTSNMWRDQYPRVMAEALAAGLPVLGEPRDGAKDRIIHGDTGFYCVDYDSFLASIKLFQRKEDYRHKMGMYAKDWARINLDPRRWIDVMKEVL